MTETRIVKIVMVGSLALFAGLVTFDNLIDYETNYAFVRHVLSMDTTLPGNALMHRSIASPSLWRAGSLPARARRHSALPPGRPFCCAICVRRPHASIVPKD
jgi:hypothetical protein